MYRSTRRSQRGILILTFIFSLFFIWGDTVTAQNLTINNSGQTGTSGTNWSTSGTNPITITFSGTSNIHKSVIEGYLNSGIDVIISAVSGGGDIETNSTTISKTQGSDATLTLRARNNVFTSSITSTAGKLNVIIWVEYDGDQIVGPSVGPITTNGGHIWIGGGSGTAIWNGLTVGNSVAFSNGTSNMNAIDLVGNLTTNGGDVFVAADGTENNSTFGDFVAWNAARTIDAGSGDISLLTEKADFSSSQGHAITLITSGTLTIAPPNSSKKWPGTFSWQGTMSGTTFTGQSSNALGLIINNYTSLSAVSIGTYLGTGVAGDNAYVPVTSTEVKDIQINSAISTSKAITIYGLSIYVNANLTTSNAIDGDIYIKGAADIIQGVGDTLRTNGADVVYWADFDGNGGRVEVLSGILSAGGNIWIGGGSSTETQNGLTVPTGYAESVSTDKQGVLINGANINSSGGTIRIKGLSDDSGNGTKDLGTMIINSTISSGSGNLSLYGTVNNDLSTGSGLWLGTEINSGVSTGNVTLSTTSGNIYIEGVSAPNNTFTWAHGLMFFATAGDDITISSTTGSISFNGNAVVAANYTDEAVGLVIQMNNTSSTFNVNTDGGAISLTGNGGNSGNDFGLGIRANNIANSIKIGDINTGKINFSMSSLQTTAQSTIGVVGIETSDSVLIEPISTSFGAAILLTDEYALASTIKYLGIGKSGNTANITIDDAQTILGPINIYGGTLNLNANLTSTATTGIGISLNGQKIIHAAGISVLTSGSNIEYLVTNSPWTSVADVAIAFSSYSGARATVNAQGGNVTINASFATTGINNSASHQEYGITVSNTDILTNGTGTISINGDIYNNASTTGQFSWGVDLRDGTVIRSASGAINITGRGGKTLANSRGVVSNTTNVQVLSNSGSITFNDLLPTGNANYTGMYFRSSSANAIKIGADGSLVTSSTSNITFNSNQITFDIADIQTSTSGKVFITPEETSFATTFSNTSLNLSSTVSELSIGKIGNNSAIGINRVISIAGPITAYGGTVNINNNITSTLAGAPISLYSTNDIDPNPASTCTITTNNGNVTVVADADANGGGNFYLGGAGVFSINSGSGNITLRTEGFSETGLSITSTGSLTIEPSDASFGAGGFTTTWINLPSTLTGLTIGKSTNTNTINFNAGVSVAGPITAYANILNLNAAGGLTTTAANAGIYLYAKENIDGNATQTFTTSNGNVYVIADSDSSGAGTLWFDAITVNIGSGNLIIKGEAISFSGNNINGTGTVTIEPSDNAFGGGIANNGLSLASTITGLTIGKTTNNTSLTFGTATTISGPITAYGGNIFTQQNLTSTLNGASILLQATGYIDVSASRTIQTTNGNITLRANSGGTAVVLPNSTTGAITLNSGSSLLSNGGNITLGGNFDGSEGAGLYAASNRSGGSPGILINNATISAAGGHINIYGKCASSYDDGIRLQATITTTGNGSIGLYGDAFGGNNGTQFFGGITFFNVASKIETVGGNIILKGILTNVQSNNTYGINFYRQLGSTGQTNHIQILSQTGNIQVTGDRTTTSAGGIGYSSWGNIYFGSPENSAYTAQGNISLTYSSFVGASANGFKVKTTGAVTYEPSATSFVEAQTFPYNSNYTVADGASNLTIGKTTNTSDINLSSAISVPGHVTVYGGNIYLNDDITSTNGGNISLLGSLSVNTSGSTSTSRDLTTSGGTIRVEANTDSNATGLLDLDYMTLNAGNGAIIIRGETMSWVISSESTKPFINTTGAFTFESNDGTFDQEVRLVWLKIANGLAALNFGKATNTSNMYINSVGGLTVNGPMSVNGAYLEFSTALTVTNNNLFIRSSSSVVQTTPIICSGLALNGTGTFTLTNTSNNFNTIAGGVTGTLLGATQIIDTTGGLTIGTVGTNDGLKGSSTIKVETLAGNLTLAGSISTTSTSTDAVILTAGKSTAIGTRTGGDIIVSGAPTITMGTGAIAKLFSGYDITSTGLTTLAGGSVNARFNYDETTSTFAPTLTANNIYAIYRTGLAYGDLNIVSSSGDAEGTTWTYVDGTIKTTSGTANILNTDIQSKLGLANLAIEANKITLSANITSSNANSLSMLSKTHIVNTNATTITTQGGNVLFASNVDDLTDNDNTVNGYILFSSGLTITTNGGNITMGGGNPSGSDYAMGTSVYPYEGLRVDGTINLNSGGGNIIMRGKSYAVSTTSGSWGMGFWNLTTGTINSGTGTITLDGFSQSSGGTHNSGLYSHGGLTLTSANTTANAIRLIGKSLGTNGQAWGIEAESDLSILATGDGGGITISTSHQSSDNHDAVFRGETNILAKSGPIQLLGKQDGGVANGTWFVGSNFYLGSKASSAVTSSSSNIIIQYDMYYFVSNPRIASSGTVNWRPASNSFGQAVYTSWFIWNQNSQTISELTIGKVGNTASIYPNTPLTVAGPIALYAGTISVGANLTSSANGDILLKGIVTNNPSIEIQSGITINKSNGTGTLTMQGHSRVTNFGNITATGTAILNVVMWSDFDNSNNDGGVSHMGTISTNGGHVWMGGSNNSGGSYSWNGLTVGDGPSIGSGGYNCNAMDYFGSIITSGGSVLIWASTNGCGTNGIVSDGTRTLNTGSGNVTLIAPNTANTIEITTTGTLTLVPNAGSYSSTLNFGGTLTSGNYTVNTGHYSGLKINSIANTANIIIGNFSGLLSGGTSVQMGNSSNVTITNSISSGGFSIYGGTVELGTGVELISTSANGDIALYATNGVTTTATSGTTRGRLMTSGGDIIINADYDNNNSGTLNIDWLTIDGSAGDVTLEGAIFDWNTSSGVTYPEFYGTGNLTFRTTTSSNHNFNLGWVALFQNKSSITIGKVGSTSAGDIIPCSACNNTATNFTGKTIQINGPVTINGSSILLNQQITATNADIRLNATNTITQTAPITANTIGIRGSANVILNNTANNIGKISAGTVSQRIGSLSFTNSNALSIGETGITGIYSTDSIHLSTLSGSIDILEPINTTSSSSNAIKLYADKNKLTGDGSGGNVTLTGNGNITVGSGGRAMIYAGKYGLSNGLQRLLTSSYIRYNVDATTSSFSPAIGAGIYGLFREGPFVWNGGSSANHNSGTNWQGNSTPPEGSYIQVSPTATNNIQLNDNWNVGYIDLPAGKMIDLNGYSLTVTGALTGSGKIKGSTTSSLIISGGGEFGTLYMDQTTNGNTNALQNFTVDRTNQTVTIADTLVIPHDGTVTPTAGTIATGNKLKLLSNLSGTGRIAQLGTNADITGDVILQRYIVGNNSIMRGWRMMSIPTTNNAYTQLNDDILVSGPGGASSGFDIAGPTSSIRTWQESTTRGWASISNINNTLSAGKGALVFFRGDRTQTASLTNTNIVPNNVTADYVGPIYKGNIAVNLDFVNDSTPIYGKGFNLLGNPYPSQIDWENLSKTAQIDNYFWVWNPVTKGYVGNATGTISSGQAFFVRATQTAQSVTFEENDKTATSTTAYFKNNQGLIVKMNLDSVQHDIAWLKFLSGASKNYVFKEDGLKLANSGYNITFITNNNVSVQHNIVDFLAPNQSDTFVMQVNSATNSAYSFSFDNINQIPLNKMVFLKDLYSNSWTDLRANNNYAFTINNNLSSTYGNRFLLIITDNYNPLPVHITAFKGERKQHINQLSWNVAQEKNIAYYQVQRSINGNDYTDIGVVKATNSSTAQLYLFNDENATDLDVAYYRLKVIEQNGNSNYSNTVVIHNLKQIASSINVYPIPTKDWINIETQEAILNVKIHDVRGKVVSEINGQNKIDIGQLRTGVYIMKVETKSGTTTHKIIKE